MTKFVHLHTHSHYSLLDGLSKIDGLVARAKENGMDSLALTDHGALYGAIEFYKKAKKAGIKPILGMEAYMAPKGRASRENTGERYYHLILLAATNEGWKNLVALSTKAHLEGFYYKPRLDKELLREYHEGLIATSACLGGEVAQALLQNDLEGAERVAREYEDIFGKGNFYLELQTHKNIPDAALVRERTIELSKRTGIPMSAAKDSHYLSPEDRDYHDVLLAVQTGNRTTDDDRLSMKADDFSLSTSEEMAEDFKDVPEAIANTVNIAERCNMEIELGKMLLPDFPKPEEKTAAAYLRELIEERLPKRFPGGIPQEVRERLEYELGIIEKMGYPDYFLIVQDLINWAKDHGIAVGPGRGSAAGSMVSYALGITDLDPLAYGLLFERFLNPERIQMPDIDIDFADTRRDEVLAYARQKYGEDRVARIITFGTMAARAAVRDAGRAMGFPYGFCDQIAKLIPGGPNVSLEDSIKNVPELQAMHNAGGDARRLLDTAIHLEGVARHASVHACATVIAKDPLIERVPLQFAPQEKDVIITQFEMHAIEELGLLKIDFLGLRNLSIIEDAVKEVRMKTGEVIDMGNLPLDDRKTFELLRKADTTGVFQFESSGMRRYMKELQPTRFEDLVVLAALFRPGPMELIPTYIKRKHGKENISYIHPAVEKALKNTYGVIVYQEQVMDMATDLAGLTRGEGYLLIKAVGKKIKSLLDEQKEKFINGCLKNNVPKEVAQKTWELIEPFAHYGFNKAHSACYAMIAYRTAYLKAHYYSAFMTALLNNELSDIERVAFLIGEAKQNNLAVLPPDVNRSFVNFTEEDGNIRFGLVAIKNVGGHVTEAIIEERSLRGPYADFSDFIRRVMDKDLNKKSLESLAKAGVFDSMGIERNHILLNIDKILQYQNAQRRGGREQGASLFGEALRPSPLALDQKPPASTQEKLTWEKELLGFYLSDHPLNAFTEKMKLYKARPIEELQTIKDGVVVRAAGVISKIHKIVTKKGQPMAFVTLEDLSSKPIELVVFNSIFMKTAPVWEQNNIVIVEGKLSRRDNETKIICDKAKVMEA